jgi:hypothetical protein
LSSQVCLHPYVPPLHWTIGDSRNVFRVDLWKRIIFWMPECRQSADIPAHCRADCDPMCLKIKLP